MGIRLGLSLIRPGTIFGQCSQLHRMVQRHCCILCQRGRPLHPYSGACCFLCSRSIWVAYNSSYSQQSALSRPLSSAFQNYQLVQDRISHLTSRILWTLNSSLENQERKAVSGSKKRPRPATEGNDTSNTTQSDPSQPNLPSIGLPPAHGGSSSGPVAVVKEAPDLSSHGIKAAAADPHATVDELSDSFHSPSGDQPSPYLQSLCPLCFGAAFEAVKELLGGVPDAVL